MSRHHLHRDMLALANLLGGQYKRYVVAPQEGGWFIKFNGKDYGPYETERAAVIFAIDAAHDLGKQGEATQVVQMTNYGEDQSMWTYGSDRYPRRD